MDEKDKEIQKIREYNYVLWAIIVIFGLMIVDLFAQHTCTDKLFVEKVSFASTLSSIILSVIAIIMTVVSNDSIGSLLHRVRDLYDNIRTVPSDIKKTSDDLNKSIEQLNSLEVKLNKIPEELSVTQITINQSIENLRNILDNVTRKVEGIDNKTDALTKNIFESPVFKPDVSSSGHGLFSDNSLSDFFSKLPTAAVLSLYICYSANVKKAKFKLDGIVNYMGLQKHIEYISAVIVVSRALGLLNLKQDIDSTCEIINIHEEIGELFQDKLSKKPASLLKQKADEYLDSLIASED